MRDLALVLNARRRKLGSIDFDLPERVIEFDPQGQMTDIVRSERNIAHRLIEEFMLCANQAVARYLEKRGLGFLHRVHEKPDAKKVSSSRNWPVRSATRWGSRASPRRRSRYGTEAGVPKRRDGRARPGGREQPMFVSVPGSMEMNIRPEHYQRLTAENCGKAGGTDHFLLDAAFAEASALCGRTARTFCAGVPRICALYLADPPLSGPDRPPRSEMGARTCGRGGRKRGATLQQNRIRRAWPRKHPTPSAVRWPRNAS